MQLLFWIILFWIHVSLVAADFNSTFQWHASPWSGCIHRDESRSACCECHKTRNVTCVLRDSKREVPPYYCHKSSSTVPSTQRPCAPCQQDCVLSNWESWSSCSSTCRPATRHRMRHLLLLPSGGGKGCDELLETDECRDLPLCDMIDPRPTYSWRIGSWSSCRHTVDSSTCGQGSKHREVQCVDSKSQAVPHIFCVHYAEPDTGPPIIPQSQESCLLPCDCQVSAWSEWNSCSLSCHKGLYGGVQTRSRDLRQPAQRGGLDCDALRETRPCNTSSVPQCNRFVWHASEWNECNIETSNGGVICGSGIQQRQITCVEEGDPNKSSRENILCVQDGWLYSNTTAVVQPPNQRACYVPCPQDCQLGEWLDWGPCSESCGPHGQRARSKPVLIQPMYGGQACGDRIEREACEDIPCSWWHTGSWTSCFPNIEDNQCGPGSQVRTVYCLSSMGEDLADSVCSQNEAKPTKKRSCQIPCSDDCTVSDWSSWSHCSVDCGLHGGVQTKNRTIEDGSACLTPEELSQTRSCAQQDCRKAIWQTSAWTPCIRMENATEECGMNSGIQTRTFRCEMEEYPVEDDLCADVPHPALYQGCPAPCPSDCVLSPWGAWSPCSHTCGKQSEKIRARRILRLAMNGGRRCPNEADSNGVVIHSKRCKSMTECPQLIWQTTDWGPCRPYGGCGYGVQRRHVACVSLNQPIHELRPSLCQQENGSRVIPDIERPCFAPCDSDCLLSSWSEFSECNQTCGSFPGVRSRTRRLLHTDSMLSDEDLCPTLKEISLEEKESCGQLSCPYYGWEIGKWGSCVPHSKKEGFPYECGDGVQRRHIFCQRDDFSHMPSHHCDAVSMMPQRVRPCQIPCPSDCALSDWSEWTVCSQICGNGTKSRTRDIVKAEESGGRPCASMTEVDICSVNNCNDLEWVLGEWGSCQPHYGMPCGSGVQLRAVTCPKGSRNKALCEAVRAEPSSSLPCDLPCMGDCKMSEWSEWTPCACEIQGIHFQTRVRAIIEEPLAGGNHCAEVRDTRECLCRHYEIMVGNWTSCVLTIPNVTCGLGMKSRPVSCRRDDGVTVDISHCRLALSRENHSRIESCDIPCHQDCELSPFTPWSSCDAPCGTRAMKARRRDVVMPANDWGRKCPGLYAMMQETTCVSVACYNYLWNKEEWSECSVPSDECGIGLTMRKVECLRSDGTPVEETHCLPSAGHWYKEESELSDNSRQQLDLHTEKRCGVPCPGDCQVSDWSEFGPCMDTCVATRQGGRQYRSRAVIVPASGGETCPAHMIDSRQCSDKDAKCPLFHWHSGSWNNHRKRKVSCVLQGIGRVVGGCMLSEKPAQFQRCSDMCHHYASCVEGICVCKKGFIGDGIRCLPEYGCEEDSHCALNHTRCDTANKECLCTDGSLPGISLECQPVPGGYINRKGQDGLGKLFIYVMIGSLGLLLLLAIVITILLVRRRKKPNKEEAPTLTKIDNLDSAHKNNCNVLDPNIANNYNKPDGFPMQYSPYSTYQSNLQPYMPGVSCEPGASLASSADTQRKHLRPIDSIRDYDDDTLRGSMGPSRTQSPQDWVPLYEGPHHRPSRTTSPHSQVVNVPQIREPRAMRPVILEDEGLKLSTFKPAEDQQPEFTPEGIIWTPRGEGSCTLPRSYQMAPMPPAMSASMDERLPPFPPAHVVDACASSSTLPRPNDTRVRSDKPRHKSSKKSRDGKSRKGPPRRNDSEESSKSASSPASELLLYCDELLADLERVAKA